VSTPSADAIVVGAGPAGAAAAFHLAAAGRRVILLERQERPGLANPCGGGMAASVQRWFPFELAPAVDQVIRRVRFTWCLEDPVTAELPGEDPERPALAGPALASALAADGLAGEPGPMAAQIRHALTHRQLTIPVFRLAHAQGLPRGLEAAWVTPDDIATYPLPVPFQKLVRDLDPGPLFRAAVGDKP
jgi:hypothetical protein